MSPPHQWLRAQNSQARPGRGHKGSCARLARRNVTADPAGGEAGIGHDDIILAETPADSLHDARRRQRDLLGGDFQLLGGLALGLHGRNPRLPLHVLTRLLAGCEKLDGFTHVAIERNGRAESAAMLQRIGIDDDRGLFRQGQRPVHRRVLAGLGAAPDDEIRFLDQFDCRPGAERIEDTGRVILCLRHRTLARQRCHDKPVEPVGKGSHLLRCIRPMHAAAADQSRTFRLGNQIQRLVNFGGHRH